jgi:pimeloyl-ACP methyl ester carboxylesterase
MNLKKITATAATALALTTAGLGATTAQAAYVDSDTAVMQTSGGYSRVVTNWTNYYGNGNFTFTAALKAPGMVKAVIAIEPSGAPGEKVDLTPLKGIPHLFVWGDYLERYPLWQKITPNVDRFEQALRKQGTDVTRIDLPKTGVRGNSHMLMMDRNSDAVAQMIQDWMVSKGLSR